MRAVLDFDREPQQLVHFREHRVHVRRCAFALGDVRLPRQPEKTEAFFRVPAQSRGSADITTRSSADDGAR